MKVKCPWCGATGTDRRPSDFRPPTKEEQKYAFEVRGNYGRRPVRKCLSCGNGVRVTFLPPRFRKVPPDEWEDLQVRWAQWKQEQGEQMEGLEERRRLARIEAGLEDADASDDD